MEITTDWMRVTVLAVVRVFINAVVMFRLYWFVVLREVEELR